MSTKKPRKMPMPRKAQQPNRLHFQQAVVHTIDISTITPKVITAEILGLRDELSPGAEFHRIKVTPMPGCGYNYCHLNVPNHIKKHGGTQVYGWKVWNQERYGFVEAEFHSVWCNPDGQLVDITPGDGEKEVLFFADPVRKYEGACRPNVRRKV